MTNINNKHFHKKAFTMIELVMVIVVLGILAALAIPRYERDLRQEAADNILSALRYTQHMALTDNVTNPRNNRWQRAFWHFGIEKCSDTGIFYYIASDKDYEGNIDSNESINDPANGLLLMGNTPSASPCKDVVQNGSSPNIFLSKQYGIMDGDVTFTNCGTGAGKYIGFDYLGRPHRGFKGSSGSDYPDFSSILTADCTITLSFTSEDNISIIIEKGTGHAYIQNQKDS